MERSKPNVSLKPDSLLAEQRPEHGSPDGTMLWPFH